jgi:hypothetical protein
VNHESVGTSLESIPIDADNGTEMVRREASASASVGRKVKTYEEVSESSASFVTRTVAQTVLVAAASAIYFVLFAGPGIGFGQTIYSTILEIEQYALLLAAGAVVVLLLMHVCDFSYWSGCGRVLKYVLLSVVAAAVAVAAMLASKSYPGAPIALYVLGFPAFIWLLKISFFRSVHVSLFSKSMGVALFIDALACAAVWLFWVFSTGYLWNDVTKDQFNEFMHCPTVINGTTVAATVVTNMTVLTTTAAATTTTLAAEFSTASVNASTVEFFAAPIVFDGEVTACLAAWVLWSAPLFAASNAFVFGILSCILSSTLRRTDKAVPKALKAFFVMMTIAVVSLWTAASIAGAGIGVNGAVNLFVGVFIMVVSAVVIGTVGWKRLTAQMMAVPLVRQLTASLFTDWFKALFMLSIGAFLPFYFLVSMLNQVLRRCLPFGYTIESDRERGLKLTAAASAQLRAIKRWRWSSVLVKMMWIAILYAMLQVIVALATNLFMSWLNDVLLELPLWATSLVLVAVGVIMLLLPPVPGVPIYITAGIVLGKQAEAQMGFWGAMGFAVLLSFLIKSMGGFIQQVGFGRGMSNSLYVRRTVGVNSVSIRAIRRLLSQPGFSKGKVAILCGGPDWPTFVLTGILKQGVLQMQLATFPIVLLIAPLVLAGGFLLKAKDGGYWQSIGDVTLTIAALLQVLSMLVALHFISKEVEENYEELAAEPNDPEVEEAERRELELVLLKQARQSWFAEDFPFYMRVVLISGAVAAWISIWQLVLDAESAFADFAVTDKISEKVNGDIGNLIFPMGWFFLGLQTWITIVLIWVGRWTAHRIKNLPPGFLVPAAMRKQLDVNPAAGGDLKAIAAANDVEDGTEPEAVKPAAAGQVAKAAVAMLTPDDAADAEAQAYKDRKRQKKEILAANSAFRAAMNEL